MAQRWLSGRQPCWRDVLHIAVKYGNSSGRNCLTMVVGTGSSAHDFVVPLTMMLRTSSAFSASGRLQVDSGIDHTVYRQHCAKRNLPVFNLLRGRF